MENLTFGHGILCEDVREEASGKFTLIGVIPGDIKADEFPLVLSLYVCFPLKYSGDKPFASEFEFRVVGPNNRELGRGSGKIELLGGAHVQLPIPPTEYKTPGEYKFQFRFANSSKWRLLTAVNITSQKSHT